MLVYKVSKRHEIEDDRDGGAASAWSTDISPELSAGTAQPGGSR